MLALIPSLSQITITQFKLLAPNNRSDGPFSNAWRLTSIEQWGTAEWTSMKEFFYYARNMVYNASDVPDLSSVTDMYGMFDEASSFNGDISNWNVSKVTYMGNMFAGDTSFNGDISNWNVSKVTDMVAMFREATSFRQNLGRWYITADTLTIANGAVANSVVATIVAQNYVLNGQNPTYTMGGGDDDADFTLISGELRIKASPSFTTKPFYTIRINSTGAFGTMNSKEVVIKVNSP